MLHVLLSKDLHLLSLCLCASFTCVPRPEAIASPTAALWTPACRFPLMRHSSDALGPLLPDMACLGLAGLVLAYKNCRPKKMPDLQAKTTCRAGWHAAPAASLTILIISKMPRLPFWASLNWLNQQRLPAKAHTLIYT